MAASLFAPLVGKAKVLLAAVALAALCLAGCERAPAVAPPTFSAAKLLSNSDSGGFLKATQKRDFSFPEDHGPHPEYRTEWWYLTGNLRGEGDRDFGYQLTFFRNGLNSDPPSRQSNWGTSELYLAHLGLTDIATGRFYSFERFSRQGEGLANAQAAPFHVYLDDWEIASVGTETFPIRLEASAEDIRLGFQIAQGKPIVLQGDQGLSAKSATPGSASYYYSFTRMPTVGTIQLGPEVIKVNGNSWMDREWSTSVLEAGQSGWDWFSLQLEGGWEIMLFELRSEASDRDFGSGKWITPDGTARTLGSSDFAVEVLRRWTSPSTKATYPASWRLTLPQEDIELVVTPRVADQEHRFSFRYWEGAVEVQGSLRGQPISGVGYVELTGYGEGFVASRPR